jgi:hypothetical protein
MILLTGLGLGATYQNLSLNIAYGFDFVNKNNIDKGKTKGIDLQIHFYPAKWAIDVLGIRHKGLHLTERGYAMTNKASYYYRPHASFLLAGVAAYRLANAERFSYNAAMLQSELQKKSAGSFLYGGQVYYGVIKDDSSLAPAHTINGFAAEGINKLSFITTGFGGGYAYTLVLQHFYLMGSAIVNMDVSFTNEHYKSVGNKKTSVNPSFIYKAAFGYQSESWNLSANWAANTIRVDGAASSHPYSIPTGNYRIILAKRLDIAGKRVRY